MGPIAHRPRNGHLGIPFCGIQRSGQRNLFIFFWSRANRQRMIRLKVQSCRVRSGRREMRNQPSRYLYRFRVPLFAFGLSLFATVLPADAQPYPSNTIRIVVGSAAGNPPDIISRVIANELGESEGWRMIVENKTGAITTIGTAEVLRQPADGYTLAAIALPSSAARALLPNVSFRLDTDFASVIKFATAYHVLVVHP